MLHKGHVIEPFDQEWGSPIIIIITINHWNPNNYNLGNHSNFFVNTFQFHQ